MDDRVAFIISGLPLGMVAINYNLKYLYCNTNWIAIGSILAAVWYWLLHFSFQNRNLSYFLMIKTDTSYSVWEKQFSLRFVGKIVLAGGILGGFYGYNLSIAYNAYYNLPFEIGANFVFQCVLSSFLGNFLYMLENNRKFHVFAPMFFSDRLEWTFGRYLMCIWNVMALSEYLSLFCTTMVMMYEGILYFFYAVAVSLNLGGFFFPLLGLYCLAVVLNGIRLIWRARRAKQQEDRMNETIEQV